MTSNALIKFTFKAWYCFSDNIKVVFFKFCVEVGVEESIVNEPLVLKHTDFSKCRLKTENTKSEVRFKQLIDHSS
jgi:hypothetical protein